MPAFVIVEITVEDAAAYEEYKQLTPASIAAYGGRFVVRGGATETLEGDWQPQRMVCWNLKTWQQPNNGGLPKPMLLQKTFVSEPHIPGCWW